MSSALTAPQAPLCTGYVSSSRAGNRTCHMALLKAFYVRLRQQPPLLGHSLQAEEHLRSLLWYASASWLEAEPVPPDNGELWGLQEQPGLLCQKSTALGACCTHRLSSDRPGRTLILPANRRKAKTTAGYSTEAPADWEDSAPGHNEACSHELFIDSVGFNRNPSTFLHMTMHM